MTGTLDWTSFQERIAAQRAARAKMAARLRAIVLATLRAGGVRQVWAEYEGYGDNGGIETVTLDPDDALDPKTITLEIDETDPDRVGGGAGTKAGAGDKAGGVVQRSLSRVLEWMLMEYVCIDFAGFENNDGGRGEITWDIAEDTIVIEHTAFYTDSSHETRAY